MSVNIFNNDCLIEVDNLEDNSVDLVICDLPYDVTNLSIVNNMYGTEILSFLDPKTCVRYSYLYELSYKYRR